MCVVKVWPSVVDGDSRKLQRYRTGPHTQPVGHGYICPGCTNWQVTLLCSCKTLKAFHMTTTAPVISRTSASSQFPERVPAYRVYAQLTSTSALQRGMLSYIAFKHRRRHRLEDNSVTCATPHCSSSTEAYQPRTNAFKSVVDSTTALLCLQPMSVAEGSGDI